MWLSHRVVLDNVHRLFVNFSHFRSDRFVQLLILILPILILPLYFLVSIDLVNSGVLAKIGEKKKQLISKLNYIFSA